MRQVLLAMCCAWFFAAEASADDAVEETKTLAERVAAIEKVVVKDPLYPDRSVLARLEAIESLLKEQKRDDQQDERRDQSADLSDVIKDMQRKQTEMQRRLDSAEKTENRDNSALARDLRGIHGDLSSMKRQLDDLSLRLKKLESQR